MQDAAQATARGQKEEARRLYTDALAQAESIGTPVRLYETLSYVAAGLNEINQPEKALPLYRRALKICKSTQASNPEEELDRAMLMCGLAEALAGKGSLDSAIKVLEESRNILKSIPGAESKNSLDCVRMIDWGHAMVLLAELFVAKDELQSARQIYLELSQTLPFTFVQKHDFESILSGLKEVLASRKELMDESDKKLQVYVKELAHSFRLSKTQTGSTVDEFTRSWNGSEDMSITQAVRLGRFHTKTKDFTSAEKILRKAMEKAYKDKSKLDKKTEADLCMAMFNVLRKIDGKNQEAEDLIVPLVERMLKEPGWDALDRRIAFSRLGVIYLESNRPKQAQNLFEHLIRIDLDELKLSDLEVGAHMTKLGECLANQEQPLQAIHWFRQALKWSNERRACDRAETNYRLASTLAGLGQHNDAEIHYKKALNLFELDDKNNMESRCRQEYEQFKKKLGH